MRRLVHGTNKLTFPASSNKFISSVFRPENGSLYFIPRQFNKLYEITESKKAIEKLTLSGFASGIQAQNGMIYLSPTTSSGFFKYNPITNNITILGESMGSGNNKFFSIIQAQNGLLYGFSTTSQNRIAVINPSDDTIRFIPISLNSTGAILHENGKIYTIPNSNGDIIEFDPITETFQTVVNYLNTCVNRTAYYGGILHPNGNIYLIPACHTHIVEFNPITQIAQNVGENFGTAYDKFGRGTLLPNGKILLAPFNYKDLVIYNPTTNTTEKINNVTGYVDAKINRFGEVLLTPNNARKVYIYKTDPPNYADTIMPANIADLPTSNYNKYYNK